MASGVKSIRARKGATSRRGIARIKQAKPQASSPPSRYGTDTLLDSRFEQDSCGVGFVAQLSGEPSHSVLKMALAALSRLSHRGAVAADGKSSDGVGIMTAIPRKFFLAAAGLDLPENALAGIGTVFFRGENHIAERALEDALASQGLTALAWRDVPVNLEVLGEDARDSAPLFRQVLVSWARGEKLTPAETERRLYLARKAYERGGTAGYICSLSVSKVVYKALCASRLLPAFYQDLSNPHYVTPFAIFHQRYATNVLPSWERAQPLRLLAHNGEINTVWGNRARMEARRATLPSELEPLFTQGGSDSTSLDEIAELLARNGRTAAESMRMLLPPGAVGRSAFVRYHEDCIEPWDGPAAIAFADSGVVGAILDRNGLRPCRYTLMADGVLVAGSEAGLVEFDPAKVVEHGRLGPGQMILVDMVQRRLLKNEEITHRLDGSGDYAALLEAQRLSGKSGASPQLSQSELLTLQQRFGYSREDLKVVLAPMAEEGKDATWSMGDDTPIPPLAHAPRPFYSYFRQRFAQVTNPAIDPLRESCVFQMHTRLGPWPHLLDRKTPLPGIYLDHPVMSLDQMAALHAGQYPHVESLPMECVSCAFSVGDGLEAAVDELCASAIAKVEAGARILLLSDRMGVEASDSRVPIPMAMAVGAVNHALVKAGLRTCAGLAVEAGDCWDVHHIAVLIGYGAGAVCPWLAIESARRIAEEKSTRQPAQQRELQPGKHSAADGQHGEEMLLKALRLGLAKIMSKMGIAAIDSYRSAQLFDILGLEACVADRCFPGTAGLLSGAGYPEIEAALRKRREVTVGSGLADYGFARFRRDPHAEIHAWQPQTVRALQAAAGAARQTVARAPDKSLVMESETQEVDANAEASREAELARQKVTAVAADEAWRTFEQQATVQPPATLRALLEIRPAGAEIELEQVEPQYSLVRRFVASAMSLGSLSPEAHQTITAAMNLLGGRSNTGEGGEDPAVYHAVFHDQDSSSSAPAYNYNNKIKQVASGRFGVTAEYLANAEELEIKIAQGSKPGEGGQLPGHKVSELIARLRHSQVGVSLISPPPHHDIYSIEDLAQLIYDLKRVNPKAAIGVKLVSECGVGTIAAGVAKAYADYVVIAGHSGGTGASPLTSIKHAGNPWELGLAETQQVLTENGLRGRIRVRVDGGLRTARDILIAALLGADEYAFGTSVLVAMGCDMARQCHLNTCPVGIATQRPDLRAKFRGRPEHVVQFFEHLAGDLRQLLGTLGLKTIAEAIGRRDLLEQVRSDGNLNLSALLAVTKQGAQSWQGKRNDRPEDHPPIDESWIESAIEAATQGRRWCVESRVMNQDRSLGARMAGAFAGRRVKANADILLNGTAGQSLGAFAVGGMRIELDGQANDFVGKGLSGGEIVLRPQGACVRESHRHSILGNVALYGATAGWLFAAGRGGERFAVRNSGARAVVEGLGDHGCEYMTGGMVVTLGSTGLNFGAGMTGGEAFVFDEDGCFRSELRYHQPSVQVKTLDQSSPGDEQRLLAALRDHEKRTRSWRAKLLMEQWPAVRANFLHVTPRANA